MMELFDCDMDEVRRAAALAAARPNPRHVRELADTCGPGCRMGTALCQSVADSRFLTASVRGERAVLFGIGMLGVTRFPAWMLGTEGIEDRPVWLLRSVRRGLDRALAAMGPDERVWQEIPAWYGESLRFVRRLGFVETGRRRSPHTGTELVRVEKGI